MTNGSCHRRCESNVHTWLNPNVSAWRASSTVREAGGFVCSTTPKSMDDLSVVRVLGRWGWIRCWPVGWDPLQQVLGEAARHVPTVPCTAAVAGLIHDDRPAGHDDVPVPVDLIP